MHSYFFPVRVAIIHDYRVCCEARRPLNLFLRPICLAFDHILEIACLQRFELLEQFIAGTLGASVFHHQLAVVFLLIAQTTAGRNGRIAVFG